MSETSRRREPKRTEPETAEDIEELTQDMFSAHVRQAMRARVAAREMDQDQDDEMARIRDRRKNNLDELVAIAAQIAMAANLKGIDREVSAEHTYETNRKNHLAKINKIERPKKVTNAENMAFAEGWVLARKPFITGVKGRKLIQEAILGTDGKIHVYARDDIIHAGDLQHHRTYSREDIQGSHIQTIAHPSRIAHVAHDGDTPYFTTVTDGDSYPFLSEHNLTEQQSLSPEDIQTGLVQFAAEHELIV